MTRGGGRRKPCEEEEVKKAEGEVKSSLNC
jgi:hypothetical protein